VSTDVFQLVPRASALPLSVGRHSAVIPDIASPHQQPSSSRQFETQLDIGRPPSWLISYPCVPCDSATAYHSFATNIAASAQAAESSAAQGSASSPRTTHSSLVHGRQDRAAVSHSLEGATHQRPGRPDKESSSLLSSLMPNAAWSRDRPRPMMEASDFAGHLHGMSSASVHPLKQVRPVL